MITIEAPTFTFGQLYDLALATGAHREPLDVTGPYGYGHVDGVTVSLQLTGEDLEPGAVIEEFSATLPDGTVHTTRLIYSHTADPVEGTEGMLIMRDRRTEIPGQQTSYERASPITNPHNRRTMTNRVGYALAALLTAAA